MIVFADVGQLEKRGPSETKLDDMMDSLLCMSFVGSIFSFLAIAVDRYVNRKYFRTFRMLFCKPLIKQCKCPDLYH